MKAVVFRPRRGEVAVEDVPPPQARSGRVQIRNHYSLISTGTERSTLHAGRQSLLGKARERPDQAREVLRSAHAVGPLESYRLVADRLRTPTPLGYSCAGTAVEVGDAVEGVPIGSLVAAGGGGYAGHAEVVSVPANLCVPVPGGVSAAHAAFTTIGAVALQAIHQSDAEPGSRVAVIGLGLVGQLAARLLQAYGYDLVGIDRDPPALDGADRAGIPVLARDGDVANEVSRRWNGAGADAVLVCASTKSADPVELAGALARDRATVVIVGDVRVAPPRGSYFGKELCIRYSRSYGPGRYDKEYEEHGISYPEGYVPWPLRRNMAEFLRLVAAGLDLDSLSPAVVPVDQAPGAYAVLAADGTQRRLAVLLRYPGADACTGTDGARPAAGAVQLRSPCQSRPGGGTLRIAASGAGSFPTRMLFPHLRRLPEVSFSWITSGTGLTAAHQGRRFGFEAAVGSLEAGLARGDADCVMVLGPHAVHAAQAAETLGRGVALFCEKPLALSEEELDEVAEAWLSSGAPAMVGFNRRFAPAVRDLRRAMSRGGPFQVLYRVFAPPIHARHWAADARQGGRVVGEVCHFIDTASLLVGSTPCRVHASGPGRSDSASIHVEFVDGSTASVLYAADAPRRAPKELIEVAGRDLSARIDDFRSLTVWGPGRRRRTTYRGGPKGHAEEMRALVALVQGTAEPEADFRASLWSSLATCRAAESLRRRQPLVVEPATPALQKLLTAEAAGDGR